MCLVLVVVVARSLFGFVFSYVFFVGGVGYVCWLAWFDSSSVFLHVFVAWLVLCLDDLLS